MLSKERRSSTANKLNLLVEHFEWVRVLGQGTFGKVFLIRNKVTKKEYALKQYNRTQLQRHNKYRSLVRSLYILQRLEHPGIIRCVNYIVPPDEDLAIYTIFESCKRGSLQNINKPLRSLQRYSLIKLIMLDLAQALAYLKSQNVAHRDIKPSNITFSREGELKIIDFDEAVCFDQKLPNISQYKLLKQFGASLSDAPPFARSLKSRASNYVGTLFYMAPEMIQSTICDQKSDEWAYGCILYELLVGSYLHIEFDTQELFQRQLAARLISFASACSDPQALDLFKSIANYNPQDRIDIEEVLKHPYFDQIRDSLKRQECRDSFVKFLRGNYNISSYGIDGLNLMRGPQVYRELKTVVLVESGDHFQFYQIISGPIYFKFKYCKNNQEMDFYIRYDRIDRLIRHQNLLCIYFYTDSSQEILQSRNFKHLYPESLEYLQNIMEVVIKD